MTNVLFITSRGLNDAKVSSINGIQYEILEVVNLFQIEN